ncbi:ABC transporter substrate-binding protein [Chroococcidiopsis sp. TS-821]|uniref:ABC transporter substrate-binding protein n=1 Tax=Chroococcidiopsis sp. TS-821 TaxID=1378066 RepID=UPI000CEF1D5E|nr:ABC transporter substrate-binding protein [Chroococcidiopsis sp. TS-821]PPS41559.1 Tat pathway signal protein [Chroococcidiopsis sp. TS-821]
MIKRLSSLISIAASLALLASCASPGANTSANNPTNSTVSPAANTNTNTNLRNVSVQLAFLFQSLDAPLILAINNGYFAAEGLNVTYERGFGNVDTISKLGTGTFDIAFSDIYNTLEFNDKNPNDKIIAVAVPINKAPFAVLTLDDAIASPQDLAGKTLGAPAGDGPRKLFPLFAKETGVDPNSVTWTTMEPRLRETFLLQGKVDAISAFSTSALPSLLKGGKSRDDITVFYYNDFGLDFYGNAILAKESFVRQNPDVIRGFVRAYLRGMQDMLRDPNAALDAVIAADQSKLMDREAEKIRLQVALEDLIITPEAEALGLGAVDPQRLQTTITQTVEGFGLSSQPTVADIFTDEFLPPKEERALPPQNERQPLS